VKPPTHPAQPANATVDVVIPVLNEAHVLEKSVVSVRSYLEANMPYRWRIVVANNGSVDGTGDVADRLAARHSDVFHLALNERGRGRALRLAWTASSADVCCYTDVDLSTDLVHLRPLVDAILVDGYDVSTGSRLLPESRTKRGFKRDVISRLYNVFIKLVLGTRFSDAQCGFKAVSRRVIREVLPQVKDQGWFLDTELLVLAEKQGYRIKDIPVKWIDDDDSRVKIIRTAWEDVKGVFRVRKALKAMQPVPQRVATESKQRTS
jgi:glycosyltransferase involved in cell wall biosynthesis